MDPEWLLLWDSILPQWRMRALTHSCEGKNGTAWRMADQRRSQKPGYTGISWWADSFSPCYHAQCKCVDNYSFLLSYAYLRTLYKKTTRSRNPCWTVDIGFVLEKFDRLSQELTKHVETCFSVMRL
jgi:hypothetical protein